MINLSKKIYSVKFTKQYQEEISKYLISASDQAIKDDLVNKGAIKDLQQYDDFIKTIIIDPFTPEALSKYPLIKKYLQLGLFSLKSPDYFKKLYEFYHEKEPKKNIFYKKKRKGAIDEIKEYCITAQSQALISDADRNVKAYKELQKKTNELHRDTFDENFLALFNYESLSEKLRLSILTQANINICPYCNRQYINHFKKGRLDKFIAHIDHFYPKSIFRLFSLTLYNLVPSCAHCNSSLKNATKTILKYPFNNSGNSQPYFKISFDSIESLFGEDDSHIHIELNTKTEESFITSKEFAHDEIYQFHKNDIKNILIKSLRYSLKEKEMLEKSLNIKLTETEWKTYYYHLNIDDIENELLQKSISKLAYDIIKMQS